MPGAARFPTLYLIAVSALALSNVSCTRSAGAAWNPAAAAAYLDHRASKWMTWGEAAREQGTVCISCHTALPYALARADLGRLLHETTPPVPQRRLQADVLQRVQGWSQLPPYYKDMAVASRGTESVLNALILADEDARQGHLRPATLAAFDDMWATQQTSGADAGSWPWIRFDNEPWEAFDSAYYGATLAALAVGSAPQDYRLRPSIQENMSLLRDYLARNSPDQTLLNRIDLLWAAQRLPGLMEPASTQRILSEIWGLQQANGGWSLHSLMPRWSRRDGTASSERSDGFATGFIALVLQQSGVSASDARLERALSWLRKHQSFWTGGWSADSPNQHRGLMGQPRHFMDDAATAFAVMALSAADAVPSHDRLGVNR
jgi:squalene-hopene/tetraprenyl-beta-curcumene cyclase